MQAEPKEPYVIQREPANSPLAPKLFSVSGPGTDSFRDLRMTREKAEELVKKLFAAMQRQKRSRELANLGLGLAQRMID